MFEEFVIFLNGVGFVGNDLALPTLTIENAKTFATKMQAEYWADTYLKQQYIAMQVVSED